MVQLQRERDMLVEEENKFDAKLENTMFDFQQLRAKQWDIDYDRLQVGLLVDNRTREALEESAAPGTKHRLAAALSGRCAGAKRRLPVGQTEKDRALKKEQQAEAVGQILDSLTRKLDALEDVLTHFALDPVKPVSCCSAEQC